MKATDRGFRSCCGRCTLGSAGIGEKTFTTTYRHYADPGLGSHLDLENQQACRRIIPSYTEVRPWSTTTRLGSQARFGTASEESCRCTGSCLCGRSSLSQVSVGELRSLISSEQGTRVAVTGLVMGTVYGSFCTMVSPAVYDRDPQQGSYGSIAGH